MGLQSSRLREDESERSKYLVYCYGSRDQQTIAEIILLNFESNKNEAWKTTAKKFNIAFDELNLMPDINLKNFKKSKKIVQSMSIVPKTVVTQSGSAVSESSEVIARLMATE